MLIDGQFTVTDVPEPPATGPGQLRIKVAACGICGSDLSMSKDPCRFVSVAAGAGFLFAVFDATRPVVLGHEWSGVVVETGPGVEDFKVDDRVTGLGITTEQNGMPTIVGYSNDYHGAFGEYIVVDAFTGYNKLLALGGRVRGGCLAHARRKIFEADEKSIALDLIGVHKLKS